MSGQMATAAGRSAGGSQQQSGQVAAADQQLVGSDGRYYQMLLENNYISDLSATPSGNSSNKSHDQVFLMEHSYSRDWRPAADNAAASASANSAALSLTGAAGHNSSLQSTRTIMVHRPPQCPSCHTHTHEEGVDMNETYNPPIPTYNEEAARVAMRHTERIASRLPAPTAGLNQDADQDWEDTLAKGSWSRDQAALFAAVSRILDLDRLARLANDGRLHEPVLRRVVIDKSVSRLRKAFARFQWSAPLTQWLHALLVDHLPATYMAAYLDAMQSMRAKLPTLVDAMMRLRPAVGGGPQAELLSPVLQPVWEPCVAHKDRRLPGELPVVVVVPSAPVLVAAKGAAPRPVALSTRHKRWLQLLRTMGEVVAVEVPVTGEQLQHQLAHQLVLSGRKQLQSAQRWSRRREAVNVLAEQMVAATRARVQELRQDGPVGRPIVLVGFNAGAALALQVAMAEQVAAVVCMGFAFNTLAGVRGTPDDRVLEVQAPVMFVLGQNAARSSQEEIESLRERMQAQSSLVVVGSADDALRVGKTKRQIEGVTQAMVDNMIIDEVAEFAANCIADPPGPRDSNALDAAEQSTVNGPSCVASALAGSGQAMAAVGGGGATKKRRGSGGLEGGSGEQQPVAKAAKIARGGVSVVGGVGRPRATNAGPTPVIPKTTAKSLAQPPTAAALDMAIASILPAASHNDQLHLGGDTEILSTFEVQPNMVLKPIALQSNTGSGGGGGQIYRRPTPVQQQFIIQPSQPQYIRTASGTSAPIVNRNSPISSQTIKMLPTGSNQQQQQFVHLKTTAQPGGVGPQKMFTISGNGSGGSQLVSVAGAGVGQFAIRGVGGAQQLHQLVMPAGQQQQQQPQATDSARVSKVFTLRPSGIGNQLLSTPVTMTSAPGMTGTAVTATLRPSAQFAANQLGMVRPQQQQQQQQLVHLAPQPDHMSGTGSTTSTNTTATMMLGQKKYTLVKQQSSPGGSAGGAIVRTSQPQIIKLAARPAATTATAATAASADLVGANIFDMPIVFADNEGNISEGQTAAVGQQQQQPLIISAQQPKPIVQHVLQQQQPHLGTVVLNPAATQTSNSLPNRSITINTIAPRQFIAGTGISTASGSASASPLTNKVVFIKGSQGQSIQIGGGVSQMKMLPASAKFTKVNVSNASSIQLPTRPAQLEVLRPAGVAGVAAGLQATGSGIAAQHKSPVIISTTGLKSVVGPLKTTTTISGSGTGTVAPNTTIVLKPHSSFKPGILNRSVTVRKVNLMPAAAIGVQGISGSSSVGGVAGQPLQMRTAPAGTIVRTAGGQLTLQSPGQAAGQVQQTLAPSAQHGTQIVLQAQKVATAAAATAAATTKVSPTAAAAVGEGGSPQRLQQQQRLQSPSSKASTKTLTPK